MLEPFYNWTIPFPVIQKWFRDAGFNNVTLLNSRKEKEKCAYHVMGIKDEQE